MKKLFAFLLTLVMILSLGTSAFAAEDTNLTIQNPDNVTRTYAGYKILTLKSSLKGDEHEHTCVDNNHIADCYNYAYEVNSTYKGILQAETFSNAGPTVWAQGKPGSSDGVTDAHIMAYLTSLTSDSADGYGTLRQAADRIYRAIQANSIPADRTGLTGTNNAIDQGYWMFVDVTDLNDSVESSNSLVIVDTKNLDSLTIAPKIDVPEVEKKVKDIEDSIDNNIQDNYWHDSADFDIGDTIPFKLTATLPSNTRAYTNYSLTFHDTLSNGFLAIITFKLFIPYFINVAHKSSDTASPLFTSSTSSSGVYAKKSLMITLLP